LRADMCQHGLPFITMPTSRYSYEQACRVAKRLHRRYLECGGMTLDGRESIYIQIIRNGWVDG
jgi:hypothetical protein